MSGCLQTHYVAEDGPEPVICCLDVLRRYVPPLFWAFVFLFVWLVGLTWLGFDARD